MKRLLLTGWVLTCLHFDFLHAWAAIPHGIHDATPLDVKAGRCIQGTCTDGYGVMVFANGDKYAGDFVNGEAHGQGILYFANGSRYYGDWEHNFRQGKGKLIYHIGHEYLGDFWRNHMHGEGTMRYANGDTYEGQWQKSRPEGQGIYTFSTGDRYVGTFSRGRFHGKGTLFFAQGGRLEGQWVHGVKDGPANWIDPSGRVIYQQWQEGKLLTGQVEVKEPLPMGVPVDDAGNPVESLDDPVDIYAVIVGIADYAYMPRLSFPDDDAYRYYAFLKSPEGGAVPASHIRILIDEAATRSRILDAMYETFARADANDVIIFYYSGHGLRGALVPIDFDGRNNLLSHAELKEAFERNAARQRLFVVDACYAGSLDMAGVGDALVAKSSMQERLNQLYAELSRCQPGTALLLSSKSGELAYEENGVRSGVFTWYLLRGLAGEADANRNGMIELGELAPYVAEKVRTFTVGAQTPVLLGDGDPRMPLAIMADWR